MLEILITALFAFTAGILVGRGDNDREIIDIRPALRRSRK